MLSREYSWTYSSLNDVNYDYLNVFISWYKPYESYGMILDVTDSESFTATLTRFINENYPKCFDNFA